MIKIESTSYSIFISDNVLEELSSFIESRFVDYRIIILVDENTEEFCLPLLSWVNSNKLNTADTLCVPAGEESKSVEVLAQLAETLIEIGATRKSLLINLGGGVVSDLGGFLAATFKRGIPFINVPTSLLAMVDASTGGKTGVNIGGFKNQLGAFCFPEAVFCGLAFLETLPKPELKSGFAEALKHGLIANSKIWDTIQEMDLEEMPSFEFIANSIRVKKEITERDPSEKGERKKLNFGHTIGHAFESFSHQKDQSITHGHAVAMGMVVESYLSVFHAKLPKLELDQIKDYIFSNYPKYKVDENDVIALIEIMQTDKKNENNGINFTLLDQIGRAEIDFNLSIEEIAHALNWYMGI